MVICGSATHRPPDFGGLAAAKHPNAHATTAGGASRMSRPAFWADGSTHALCLSCRRPADQSCKRSRRRVGGWQQPLFIGLALVISILLVYWLWRSPRVLSYRLALSAILGGALGNVADRLRLGYVEDFLDFHYAQWHWPSFNLADVWIFLGVALFIWAEIRHQPGSRRR